MQLPGKSKTVEKGTLLLSKGEIVKSAFRVEKGCLKSYVIDDKGKEHILQFAPEGWLITDMNSLFNSLPSSVFIEAIEDSEVTFIPNTVYNSEKLEPSQLMEANMRLVRNIIALNKRLTLLLASSAEDRYLDFIETYPTLFQRLPLKLIASYLGVTPQYISEIRKNQLKK